MLFYSHVQPFLLFFYATRKFAYDEADVCWTDGGIHIALEHQIYTLQSQNMDNMRLGCMMSPVNGDR